MRQSAEQNSVTSQSPLSQKHSVRHTEPQESVHAYLTRSTMDAARAVHAHVQPHVTPTWFHSLTATVTATVNATATGYRGPPWETHRRRKPETATATGYWGPPRETHRRRELEILAATGYWGPPQETHRCREPETFT